MPTDSIVTDPEVVCLCGSTRFKEQYRAENRRLTMDGELVLSVGLFGHADGHEFTDAEKEMLDSLHKRKIDLADRVHVINPGGYIGESTRSEIAYAQENGVPVTFYDDPMADSDLGPCDCPECGSPGQLFDDGRQVGCPDCGTTWRVD